ncbi:FlgK family flagellar hook-associated protein [Halodesulfovibrio marinisediminis]|uniref:Flagellar hook-associated protein 1 n=1 Tax=Halodesulfovibrio marinisediminis DSM 17456 TaxID=1121457 RepID=A0A1N6J4Q7_9BACT|nr:flagellar basal body rod C-terminal domain-containing protein [Halodesulfovibrio marinisediminis]SIO39235.1 flagellar hook-associated protein 1 FlgK [Halodesulfovibrio marinisediminis DSM 17456]
MAITSLLNLGGNTVYTPPKDIKPTDSNIPVRNTGTVAPADQQPGQNTGIYYLPGLMNISTTGNEVISRFVEQVEHQTIARTSDFARWDSQREMLLNVDSMFATEEALGSQDNISRFFDNWKTLSQKPQDATARQNVLNSSDAMVQMLRGQREMLESTSKAISEGVQESLVELNEKLQALVDVNARLASPESVGARSDLIRERNAIVHAISEKLDIETSINTREQMQVSTRSGFTLVDGTSAYTLHLSEPSLTPRLTPASTFDGSVTFEGTSSREVVLEVTQGGAVGTGEVRFRASLDGKRSWLSDAEGNDIQFTVAANGSAPSVQGLNIKFNSNSGMLAAGDTINIVPKQHVTGFTPQGWVNVTPQSFFDGSDNELRITGGQISGLMQLRDNKLGKYLEKLDSLVSTIITEVNKLHAQGASTIPQSEITATNGVINADAPLSSNASGLATRQTVSAGKMTLFAINTETGKPAPTTAYGIIDFSGVAPYVREFDPAVHSLNNVRDAISSSLGQFGSATIEENVLQITAAENYTLSFGEDSSHLFAALGMNTYFAGTTAKDMKVHERVRDDESAINAGIVNNAGAVAAESSETAKFIAALKDKTFSFNTPGEATKTVSAREYYSSLSAQAKDDATTALYKTQFNEALLLDLSRQNATIHGSNLDADISEMTRFQHSYKAAAKLITSAEDMMQVIAGMPN